MQDKLERFRKAQRDSYDTALCEIQNGQKRSHWMWYIFPQIDGLGYSETARYYAMSVIRKTSRRIEKCIMYQTAPSSADTMNVKSAEAGSLI
jgi:uncharacterized protein (DUF1810 family)